MIWISTLNFIENIEGLLELVLNELVLSLKGIVKLYLWVSLVYTLDLIN
mgnify:FL=1